MMRIRCLAVVLVGVAVAGCAAGSDGEGAAAPASSAPPSCVTVPAGAGVRTEGQVTARLVTHGDGGRCWDPTAMESLRVTNNGSQSASYTVTVEITHSAPASGEVLRTITGTATAFQLWRGETVSTSVAISSLIDYSGLQPRRTVRIASIRPSVR
ncbi:hypothetical protein ACMA1D_08750 [Streptomyces sp. 796.1]|uniref:hypothetical protein n=1 Tax=Streptomyces sp. 796.1 TaxID=3163029 RepID=UPI0039C91ED3